MNERSQEVIFIKNTREKILEASLILFSKKGYAATSVRQIAKKVGVREGALYNHFENKEAILRGLFQYYGAGRSRAYLRDRLFKKEAFDNPKEFLRTEIVNEILRFINDTEANKFKKIVLMEMFCGKSGKEIIQNELFDAAVNTMEEIFQILIDRGHIENKYSTELLATEFISSLLFLNLRYLLQMEEIEEKEIKQIEILVEGHVEFFMDKVMIIDDKNA